MSVELYSALNAPTLWGESVGLLVVACVGGFLLWGSLQGKCWMRHLSGPFGIVIQFSVGAIFFSVPTYFHVHKWIDTYSCRAALREGDVTRVAGGLTIEKKFEKPGFGYITFGIDGHSYTTHFAGVTCDCGFIEAIGRRVEGLENQTVTAKIHQGVVLSVETSR